IPLYRIAVDRNPEGTKVPNTQNCGYLTPLGYTPRPLMESREAAMTTTPTIAGTVLGDTVDSSCSRADMGAGTRPVEEGRLSWAARPGVGRSGDDELVRHRHGRLGLSADDREHAAVLGSGRRWRGRHGPLPRWSRPTGPSAVLEAGADPRRAVRPR